MHVLIVEDELIIRNELKILLENALYRDMFRRSNKSVIERIHQIEDAQKDYKEITKIKQRV